MGCGAGAAEVWARCGGERSNCREAGGVLERLSAWCAHHAGDGSGVWVVWVAVRDCCDRGGFAGTDGGRNLFRSGHRRQEATLRARVQDDWRATAGALQGAARSEQHRVSVHGGDVAVDEWKANESLCRDIARPAPANERVQTHAAGQLVLRIKTVWRDGTTHLVIAAAARPTERRLRRSPTRSFTWSGGVVAR